MKDVKDFLEYRKDIQFDACYQKIGNVDMDYPYILFKNVYATTTNEDEIKKNQYMIMLDLDKKELKSMPKDKIVDKYITNVTIVNDDP